jgi:hypothetical protein
LSKKRSDVRTLFFAPTAYAAILFAERNYDKRYNQEIFTRPDRIDLSDEAWANKKAVSSWKRLGRLNDTALRNVPFAGITQIRFQGYILRLPAATPLCHLNVI